MLAAVPAGAVWSQLGWIRRALAQGEGAFREQLQESRDIAGELANYVREVEARVDDTNAAELRARDYRVDDINGAELRERDYRGRHDLASAASDLSQEQLHAHVREDFVQVADAMVVRAVPLIPPPRDIVRVSTLRLPVGDSCPPVGEVMWDILFDALGLLDEREFFMEALRAVSGTTERVERINDSLNEGRWEEAIDGFFDLREFLLDGGTIILLVRMLEERLARRFLRAVAFRLVPFVGTGYAIVAFGLAVHRHRDRLFCPH